MQKLSEKLIDRMIQEQLSSAEVDFIIYLSRYQDDYGMVSGVYYKEFL